MRRDGKTTRAIDNAIQILFTRGKIIFPTRGEITSNYYFQGKSKEYRQLLIFDEDGYEHQMAQNDLFERVIRRLRMEHNLDQNKGFKVTKNMIFYED